MGLLGNGSMSGLLDNGSTSGLLDNRSKSGLLGNGSTSGLLAFWEYPLIFTHIQNQRILELGCHLFRHESMWKCFSDAQS